MSSAFVPMSQEELEVPWPEDYEHFSASSMMMLMRCPEQWRRVYCMGERRRPSANSVHGAADHAAIADHLRLKMVDGVGLTTPEVQELVAVKFDERIGEEGGYDEIDWKKEGVASAAAARKIAADRKDEATRVIRTYHDTVSPSVDAVSVEDEFYIEHPSWPKPLKGYTDVTTAYELIERKVVGRRDSRVPPEAAWQGRIYQLKVEKPFVLHQSVRTKVPQAVVFEPVSLGNPVPVVKLVARLFRLAGHYLRTYGPEETWPGGVTHTWACGYCGFRPTCEWHS